MGGIGRRPAGRQRCVGRGPARRVTTRRSTSRAKGESPYAEFTVEGDEGDALPDVDATIEAVEYDFTADGLAPGASRCGSRTPVRSRTTWWPRR